VWEHKEYGDIHANLIFVKIYFTAKGSARIKSVFPFDPLFICNLCYKSCAGANAELVIAIDPERDRECDDMQCKKVLDGPYI
jgi:hypothetical protein